MLQSFPGEVVFLPDRRAGRPCSGRAESAGRAWLSGAELRAG